jgi:very-short-patch-repair endonuclease
LEASWKNRGQECDAEWLVVNEKLRIHRDQLNAYTAAIHTPEANGWTAFRAMGECVRGRAVSTPTLRWPSHSEHTREQYEELEEITAKLAAVFRALPAGVVLPRLEETDWSIAWETRLLDACRQLEQAAVSLQGAIRRFSVLAGLPAWEDVNSQQLSQLYHLGRELVQPSLPPNELLLHGRLDELQALLEARVNVLQQQERASRELDSALSNLLTGLGADSTSPLSDDQRRAYFRLANELVRPAPPPAELVFHAQFDRLESKLAERTALLATHIQAREALQARAYSGLLLDRIDIETLESDWQRASRAFWPFSAWKKAALRKKLKAYMTPAGVPEPELDLSLLRDYSRACDDLAEHLVGLELPPPFRDTADSDPAAIAAQLPDALRVRTAMSGAGLSPTHVATAASGRLDGLIDLARRLYPPGRELEALRAKLNENLASLGLSPSLVAEVEQDAGSLSGRIQAAANIRRSAGGLGLAGDALNSVLQHLANAEESDRRAAAAEWCRSAKAFQEAWSEYKTLAKAIPAATDSVSMVADAAEQAGTVQSRRGMLKQWTSWQAIRKKCAQVGLEGFAEQLQSGLLTDAEVVPRFRLAYARWWLPQVVDRREPIRRFQKFLHEDAIEEFRRLDELARQAATSRARHSVQHGLPPSDQVPRKSELGLLRHQMTLKRPSKSIREIVSGMPEAFGRLAPCLLMSPLSIAQYLPAGHALFDVVVFDEASQIATWDAIGAIARGKQTIIVGDPKQLPPTNFFGKTDSDDGDPDLADHEKDLESILDEAQASGLPTLQLNWHYRSRHESLIAFSNWNYYGNRLVTFPAAESVDRGVSLRHVNGALFDRGKSRTNRQEAEAIVADLVVRMKRCLAKPEKQRLTYGVVTFNSQQQELIQDLLDDAQRKHTELEWFFSDERVEPTVVKNLENVQGDERDVMMFSITFGYDAAGKFYTNFGALNRDGGERRLNVAITRARQELVVFSSFLPEQLAAERSSARGVHDLKAFLEYARTGPQAIAARIEGSQGGFDSPLEEAIAKALEERGWRIETQIGVSGFRIDLGVVHPDKPGAYLAGIECDGATYHRSAVARDRDKIREEVLTGLGWRILRVWSTDWWYDSDCALEEIHIKLQAILEQDRSRPSIDPRNEDAAEAVSSTIAEIDGNTQLPSDAADSTDDFRSSDSSACSPLVARQAPMKDRCIYFRVNLGDAVANQDRFFDTDYADSLRQMAQAVLASQGPIRDDALVREIARAHGFARTGNRIKQRVLELLPDVASTQRRLQIVGDLLGQARRDRAGRRCLPGSCREPEDVQVRLVPLDDLVVVEAPPAAFGGLLAPGGFAAVAVLRVVAGHELVQVGPLQRVRLQREVHVRPQVVHPQLLRPGLLLGRLGVEEQDVGLHALGVEDAGRQPQQRVDVALFQQVAAHRLAGPALEQHVVRHDDGAAPVDLQQRLDVLQEVQLLVLRRRPEILPLVGRVFLLQIAFLVDDGDAALLAERRIGQHHAEPLARIAGQRIHARADRAGIGVDAVQVQVHDAQPGRVGDQFPALDEPSAGASSGRGRVPCRGC